MSSILSPSLIDQARLILDAATGLQEQLDRHKLPQPGFECTARRNWHDASKHEEILNLRSSLIDATQNMLNLALGPTDKLIALSSPSVTEVEVFRTLDELRVPQNVPLEGSISIETIAEKVGVESVLLHRFLKFAYTMGMFHEPADQPGAVAHTALSAAMPSFSPYTQMKLSRSMFIGAWEVPKALKNWKEASLCGHVQIPVEIADPQHRGYWRIIEEDDPDGKGTEKFAASMKVMAAAHSDSSYSNYAHGFDWAALGNGKGGLVVDVGGGAAHIEVNIANALPSTITFLVQDLPANEAAAKELIRGKGLEDRINFQVHDFFHAQPAQLQPVAYFLSRVLHDWQDHDAIRIIKPLIPAMEKGAKLFVSERMLPDQPGEMPLHKEQLLRSMDIMMFTIFGAKERSQRDFAALFQMVDKRLKIHAVTHPPSSIFSMMEVVLVT